MPKKTSENVDTEERSAMTTEEVKSSDVVDNSKVSKKEKKKEEKPRVMSLDDFEAFDPSATHEDLSEDDNFDDDDESY
ncbi:MAG: hypothetical protein IKA36_03950 [Clostridia bacterium]|nr:hypothetical protein [Clostridia bacterium]